jgi:hypothetical protein
MATSTRPPRRLLPERNCVVFSPPRRISASAHLRPTPTAPARGRGSECANSRFRMIRPCRPASLCCASAEWIEVAQGSHSWRPEGAVMGVRPSAPHPVIAPRPIEEAPRHPFQRTSRDIHMPHAARGARRCGPGQDRRHRAMPPIAEGGGRRVRHRRFTARAGPSLVSAWQAGTRPRRPHRPAPN